MQVKQLTKKRMCESFSLLEKGTTILKDDPSIDWISKSSQGLNDHLH
jgi:hypothetical protein